MSKHQPNPRTYLDNCSRNFNPVFNIELFHMDIVYTFSQMKKNLNDSGLLSFNDEDAVVGTKFFIVPETAGGWVEKSITTFFLALCHRMKERE